MPITTTYTLLLTACLQPSIYKLFTAYLHRVYSLFATYLGQHIYSLLTSYSQHIHNLCTTAHDLQPIMFYKLFTSYVQPIIFDKIK